MTDYDPTPSLWRKYFHNRNRKNLQDNRFLLSYVEAGRRMRMECQTESGAKWRSANLISKRSHHGEPNGGLCTAQRGFEQLYLGRKEWRFQ